MRWQKGRSSGNTIDARGSRAPSGRVAIPGGLGLVGVLVFIAIQVLGGGSGAYGVPSAFDDGASAPEAQGIPASQDPDRDLREFSEYVFDSAQTTWAGVFDGYRDAKLYLYRSAVRTGCGQRVLRRRPVLLPRRRARVPRPQLLPRHGDASSAPPGDFAWAYVIAHEVGHHVQKLRGTSDEVRAAQRDDPEAAQRALGAARAAGRLLRGRVGARRRSSDLEPGDVEEAITASEAVGDDRLQRRASGSVDPDSFTHGTSAQRARWFETGRKAGEPADCDTFSAEKL